MNPKISAGTLIKLITVIKAIRGNRIKHSKLNIKFLLIGSYVLSKEVVAVTDKSKLHNTLLRKVVPIPNFSMLCLAEGAYSIRMQRAPRILLRKKE